MSNLTLGHHGPRKDHIGLDFEKLLRVGVEGLIAEIEQKKAALDLCNPELFSDPEPLEQ